MFYINTIEKPATRGVYGIFVEEECVYIGSANCLYNRIFREGGHIFKIRNSQHISKLICGFKSGKKISIRILEKVALIGDDPGKDIRRLNEKKKFWIEFYEEMQGQV